MYLLSLNTLKRRSESVIGGKKFKPNVPLPLFVLILFSFGSGWTRALGVFVWHLKAASLIFLSAASGIPLLKEFTKSNVSQHNYSELFTKQAVSKEMNTHNNSSFPRDGMNSESEVDWPWQQVYQLFGLPPPSCRSDVIEHSPSAPVPC